MESYPCVDLHCLLPVSAPGGTAHCIPRMSTKMRSQFYILMGLLFLSNDSLDVADVLYSILSQSLALGSCNRMVSAKRRALLLKKRYYMDITSCY